MKKLLVFLFCFMLISCPLQQGDEGTRGKDGLAGENPVMKTVLIFEGEVPAGDQIIDLSQYVTRDQEIYLIVYNLGEKKLCYCPFVFNFQVDNFDKESYIIKNSQQFNRIVTKDSKIVWSAFGNKIKIELKY